MKLISSTKNSLIKEITLLHSKKGRDQLNLFLIEGIKSIDEALKSKLRIKLIAFKEGFEPPEHLLNSDAELFIFSESCFEKVSTTDTPGNAIAVAEKFRCDPHNIIKSDSNNKLLVILDNIKDPGNLGTIIRTTCASGADGILLTDFSVDIFNTKVIRSTAGTLWKLPIVYFEKKQQLLKLLKTNGFTIYSADMSGNKNYYSVDYNNNIAIIFGSEAAGVSDIFKEAADEIISIPISEKVESLNVASSVAIVLFEARKQKR